MENNNLSAFQDEEIIPGDEFVKDEENDADPDKEERNSEGEPGDEDADFDNPTDDPA